MAGFSDNLKLSTSQLQHKYCDLIISISPGAGAQTSARPHSPLRLPLPTHVFLPRPHSKSSTPSSPPSSLLSFPSPSHSQSNPPSPLSNADKPPPEDEPEYDFPLFTPHPTASTSQPITNRVTSTLPPTTPSPRPNTVPSHTTSPPSPSSPLLSCAISGEDILAHARGDRWLGQTYAWRLITVPTSPTSTAKPSPSSLPDWEKRKRCKPGKKRRIYLRQAALKKEAQKLALGAQRQAEAERKKKEEEEANLKRMLKNRERKAKKRAREKAKNVTAGGGGGAVEFDGAGGEGESARESAGVEGEMMDVDE
ncbi:hypothetical protein L211DRAFT_850168 [Terfezia boudieri ATCC MYA-4762]|uniref:Uncharacterized protein n=1 Tax=Terfezia boudieri ATCC MYA-4762 TaxID=1051890 RepID=A0A3N4LJS0_9PEZI|nr:hypothetical protein L211DRAFT_850168 [Terfezia boudieri ATCC MYA-4762]